MTSKQCRTCKYLTKDGERCFYQYGLFMSKKECDIYKNKGDIE